MAYKYQQNMFDGAREGYVKYNITPDFSSTMGVGDTFTVTGQLYWKDSRTRSIYVQMGAGLISETPLRLRNPINLGCVNKSVSKAKTGTFSIDCTVTQEFIDTGTAEASGLFTGYLGFVLCSDTDCAGTRSDTRYASQAIALAQSYQVIKQRSAPTINSVSFSDRYPASSKTGNQTPYAYFNNGYIQGVSLPRITVSFTILDNKLDASHQLILSGGTLSDPKIFIATTKAGDSSVNFDIPAPSNYSGQLRYTYKITDHRGEESGQIGSFIVYPYTKPSISNFSVIRYKYDLETGQDVEADDGENVWVNITGNIQDISLKNASRLVIKYVEENSSASPTIVYNVSYTNGRSFVFNQDKTIFANNTLDDSKTYEITAELSDTLGNVTRTAIVLKAGGYMNIEKTGVAVGMRSTSEALKKKFEVAEDYTSYFYGGINGVTTYSTDEIKTGGKWIDGKPLYRKTFVFTGAGGVSLASLNYDYICILSQNVNYYNSNSGEFWGGTYFWSGNSDRLQVYIRDRALYLRIGGDNQINRGAWITLEYTKTTD